jgi:hypothetical protein
MWVRMGAEMYIRRTMSTGLPVDKHRKSRCDCIMKMPNPAWKPIETSLEYVIQDLVLRKPR